MPALQPSRVHIGSSGHFWSTYQCIADEAHSPDDALAPDYWAHVASARQMRVHDKLEVRCENGQWSLDLTVTAVIGKAIRVRAVSEWTAADYDPGASEDPVEGIVVAWKGPSLKWCIIRGADREYIKQGLASKADATREALEYEKVLA
jgi:hypothetical protein